MMKCHFISKTNRQDIHSCQILREFVTEIFVSHEDTNKETKTTEERRFQGPEIYKEVSIPNKNLNLANITSDHMHGHHHLLISVFDGMHMILSRHHWTSVHKSTPSKHYEDNHGTTNIAEH